MNRFETFDALQKVFAQIAFGRIENVSLELPSHEVGLMRQARGFSGLAQVLSGGTYQFDFITIQDGRPVFAEDTGVVDGYTVVFKRKFN